MGCWEETCAVTQTPIFEGDSCVMVVLNKNEIHTYSKKFPETITDLKYVETIYKGNYDSYGWIVNEKHDDWNEILKNKYRVFFHLHVWNAVVEFMKNQNNNLFKYYKEFNIINSSISENIMEEFTRICSFCALTRKSILSCEDFSGSQSYDIEQHYELISKLIQKQCKTMKKLW